MATMILLPTGVSGNTSHWEDVPATTHHDALDDDNGDTSYVWTAGNLRQITLGFADPSVAEADITSITSVRFLSSGRSTHRSNPALVDISFVTPFAGYSETMSYDAHRSNYETLNGTVRTYPKPTDASSVWEYDDLENLALKMTKNGTVEVRVSYLAIEVTYEEAAGYGNLVSGVASGDISSINGVATANIEKVIGVD